jgi:hypothetical protein
MATSSAANRAPIAGTFGCVVGFVVAAILCVYPLPAVVALVFLLLERVGVFRFQGHPGEIIYPIIGLAFIALPLAGFLIGVRIGHRRP